MTRWQPQRNQQEKPIEGFEKATTKSVLVFLRKPFFFKSRNSAICLPCIKAVFLLQYFQLFSLRSNQVKNRKQKAIHGNPG